MISNQSFVFTDIESFPFEQRLSLDSFLKKRIVWQNRRIDVSPVEKYIKKDGVKDRVTRTDRNSATGSGLDI